jgi:hypothetical protein
MESIAGVVYPCGDVKHESGLVFHRYVLGLVLVTNKKIDEKALCGPACGVLTVIKSGNPLSEALSKLQSHSLGHPIGNLEDAVQSAEHFAKWIKAKALRECSSVR